MNKNDTIKQIHPAGESKKSKKCSKKQLKKFDKTSSNEQLKCDTFGGSVHMEWDEHQPVTPFGQLPFFIDFLKTSRLFKEWVASCPLMFMFKSANAPKPINVLGTLFLSSLAGQKRYAHITSIRNDELNPPLLGMTKVVSEDSARRAFKKSNAENCECWQLDNLKKCYEALLVEDWILDIDTSVKPLYGHQEGAEVAYNPKKPGRPCHTIHTFMMAQLRIVLDCEVLPGKQGSSSYTMPMLWKLLDSLPREKQPTLLRGDCAFGNEKVLSEAERRYLKYLFKLKKTPRVKTLINALQSTSDWVYAGQGWEGIKGVITLHGWSKARNVIVLRKEVQTKEDDIEIGQLLLPFEGENKSWSSKAKKYEYQVLVTDIDMDVPTIAQLYRDRCDGENVFDELKNQWGWAGFVTKDLKRSQIMARIIAQVYNWWLLFVRLANRDKHSEGITSRPLLLHGVARQTISSRQKKFTITSTHGKRGKVQERLRFVMRVLSWVKNTAEQCNSETDFKQLWIALLSIIFAKFLKGNMLGSMKTFKIELPVLEFA